MKKIILVFGIVIGAILSAKFIYTAHLMYTNPEFKSSAFIGYASLVIIFSLIYFGVRNYRDQHLDGVISFGQAFKKGALICLIASTVYTILGLGYYYIFAPDFIDVFTDYMIRNAAPENVEATTQQMASFKEMYKNPLFAIFITYMEVLPIGMIVALFSALLVKKK